MTEIPDGKHDVLIINATDIDEHGVARLEVVITSGAAKGSTVMMSARNLPADPLSYLGLPARLEVLDGSPNLIFE